MGFESTLYLNMYSILILGIVLFNLYKKYGINNKVTKWFVAMILRIVSDNTELDWGKQDVIDYTPNI